MTYSGIGIYRPEIFTNEKVKKYKLIDILKAILKNKISGLKHKVYGMMLVM
jgi:hypothetical protein